MRLTFTELAAGRYEVRCNEKPLEHVLFVDEEAGYCLLGATDLQGNLLAASDPDAGYPYETVRVDGAVRVVRPPFPGAPVTDDAAPWSGSTSVTFAGGESGSARAEVESVRLRRFGMKLELSDAALLQEAASWGPNWAGETARWMQPLLQAEQARLLSVSFLPPGVPPPTPHPAAERVVRLLRLRSGPGRHAARFTVCVDQDEGDRQEYLLVAHAAFADELQLALQPCGVPSTRPPRYFLVQNPQMDVQILPEYCLGGPPVYDPGTGCMIPSPVQCDSRTVLRFSPGAAGLGPLGDHQHWELLEAFLDNLIELGWREDGEEEDDPGDA